MRVDVAGLQHAVDFAIAHATPWDRSNSANWGIHNADRPSWNRLLGPVHPRGPVSGVVRIDRQQLIESGEPRRADPTFSIAKTYLAMLAGVACERGLLPDFDAPVGASLAGIGFDSPHNRRVTWMQLLQRTSEWQGECFGVPDQVDRYRPLQYQPAREPRFPSACAKGMRVRCRRRAVSGNTTTCASTSCRWRYGTCFVGRCPRCSAKRLPGRVAPATTGAGKAMKTAGFLSTASAYSRCPVARTGAAVWRLAAPIRRSSARGCSTRAASAASVRCQKNGFAACRRRARSRPGTAS